CLFHKPTILCVYYRTFTLQNQLSSERTAKKAGEGASAEDELSAAICRGLGGKKNISDVDCCATRLRCTVFKPELVDDAALKATGASGVVHKGNGVQIIYGPRVTVVKSNLEDYLEHAPEEEYVPQQTETVEETAAAENNGKVVDTIIISSPVNGKAADLSETPDEAFAGRMMGDGAMVVPEEGIIFAPEDGEVCFIFNTKHAIGFQTESGVTMLLHIGIDTVKLDGKGFEPLVKEGDKVKKGDPMMKVDLDYVKANAPSLATPVLCTELEEHQKIRLLANGNVKVGEPLFAIDIYER
ncbi:MAG: PTS glucose transporter subunit IIA, partial [Tyzzerella sp.]|nr:PTS glucose transporter subunit IIA [Tyzzerella sp.]